MRPTSSPQASPSLADQARRGLRALTGLQAALVLLQAVLAGHLLTGSTGARTLHQAVATDLIMWVAAAQLVAAIVCWRPGRGPWWPIPATAGLFAALVLQLGWGFWGRLALHLPVGVALLAGNLLLASTLRPTSSSHPMIARHDTDR